MCFEDFETFVWERGYTKEMPDRHRESLPIPKQDSKSNRTVRTKSRLNPCTLNTLRTFTQGSDHTAMRTMKFARNQNYEGKEERYC